MTKNKWYIVNCISYVFPLYIYIYICLQYNCINIKPIPICIKKIVYITIIVIQSLLMPTSAHDSTGMKRSREAKRAVSSVLKVTKPVEVQTKGSPGDGEMSWDMLGFPRHFPSKSVGKMVGKWGDSTMMKGYCFEMRN